MGGGRGPCGFSGCGCRPPSQLSAFRRWIGCCSHRQAGSVSQGWERHRWRCDGFLASPSGPVDASGCSGFLWSTGEILGCHEACGAWLHCHFMVPTFCCWGTGVFPSGICVPSADGLGAAPGKLSGDGSVDFARRSPFRPFLSLPRGLGRYVTWVITGDAPALLSARTKGNPNPFLSRRGASRAGPTPGHWAMDVFGLGFDSGPGGPVRSGGSNWAPDAAAWGCSGGPSRWPSCGLG